MPLYSQQRAAMQGLSLEFLVLDVDRFVCGGNVADLRFDPSNYAKDPSI